MLAKSVKVLLLGGALGILSACSTPCDAPGRLCAPISSITSTPTEPPALRPAPAPVRAEPQEEPAQTFRVDSPDTAAPPPVAAPDVTHDTAPATAPDSAPLSGAARGGAPIRIGLLLPLRSEALGQAAAAVRDGFLAAYERERDGFVVSVIESGEGAQDALAGYARAQEEQDILVGPLARSAVTAVAASALVRKPTIALNHPDGRGRPGETALPPAMLVIGLSIEDEARQAAAWAAAEQPGARALIVSAGAPWQRRSAAAFAAQWQRMGLPADSVDLGALNGYLADAELVQLRARVQNTPPGLLFAALDADQALQLRVALGSALPLYGTSSLNPGAGRGEGGAAMDGVRLLDLPWQVQRDHPAVMVYPQPLGGDGRRPSADMERLYALGIDAFRVAREIALHPAARFRLDGVTGKLSVSFGQGAASFERVEQGAVYRNGALAPLAASEAP